ncbi:MULTISPECIES: cadmium resistance transporter [Fischerella]|uniref:Transporter n=1 Tax=Fischerella muscicola CCMEE 5323 TaxID=2019572 RepID=A0A2N6JU19_FISMU|nr:MULTISPECIES: cadmium resistance transporter [Fischerella]MBD2433951.1 cadmium resistance transporter [Fischerella sp. FACHB-380]PLZ80430.1 transporter [Fischerella muscicola CCMEE 5323]
MSPIIATITEAIIAFAATNIDDIIILLLFFSQLDTHFRRRHIFIGQYLGFTAIILASLPGFFGGLVVSRVWIGLLGILPIAIGIKQLLNKETENTEIQTVNTKLETSTTSKPILNLILSILSPQTYKVAAVTFANGGDNIGIYIPLFAGNNFASLIVILIVFFIMVGVWCAVAYLLSRQAKIAYILSRYGKKAVPFVLIALGLYIMYERGTFTLLRHK